MTATNPCGNTVESITVDFTPCIDPSIQMIEPLSNTVSNVTGTQVVKAKLLNVAGMQNIKLFVNGNLQVGGIFNSITKIYEKTVGLNAGANTIQLIVSNDCGTDAHTFTVNYNPCDDPDVQVIAPSNGLFTDNASTVLQAYVYNATSLVAL